MTRGRTPNKDGWITVGVKLRESDVKQLDEARGAVARSQWIRQLVLAELAPQMIAPGAFDQVPVTSGGQQIGTAAITRDQRGLIATTKISCPHPKARRSKGGLCMACGANAG